MILVTDAFAHPGHTGDLFEKLPESVRIANVSPMGEDGPVEHP